MVDAIQAEYFWIGGPDRTKRSPFSLRSKTRIFYETIDQFPIWNYDGSSTGQASTEKSEVLLVPKKVYCDPFRGGKNKLILCETYVRDEKTEKKLVPHETNSRYLAEKQFQTHQDVKALYGIEQEFFLISNKTGKPLGFPEDSRCLPNPQGQYYCSVGSLNAYGRNIVQEMVDRALQAGVKISGMNSEVAPGQHEIQVGPCEGISAGDDLWTLRYIMERVTENYDCHIELFPKPLLGNWNGSGAHTNFSTQQMRDEKGLKYIYEAIEKLGKKHKEHMEVYGEGNDLRLTGQHETSSLHKFTFGVGNRAASIRIPTETAAQNCGYLEDRRPSSLMDPYLVTQKLLETTVSNI
jgi:glutamine synthetase